MYKYKNWIIILFSLIMLILPFSCKQSSYNEDYETGTGYGDGDSTNTLRYQNRKVK
jgi:hypothetical protein